MTRVFVLLLALTLISSFGCGGKHSSVSGKVTVNGNPVPMVRVVFTPSAVGDNHTPGPYSLGVTDEEGRYTLKTRYGDRGAVAGPHKVGFEWADVEFDELPTLQKQLNGGEGDAEKNAALKNSIDEIKRKLASRPKFKVGQVFEINVPKTGMKNADFELGKSDQ